MIERAARRDAHDRDVSRALMVATLSRVKEPAALANKLYNRRPRARPQTTAEGAAVARALAARFGWKARPHTAIVLED